MTSFDTLAYVGRPQKTRWALLAVATALVLAGLPGAALARTVDGGWQPIGVQTCGTPAPTCDTEYSRTVTTVGLLRARYRASASHETPVRITFLVDGVVAATTQWLLPGDWAGPFQLGPVSAGQHELTLRAEGQADVTSWAGELEVWTNDMQAPLQWNAGDDFASGDQHANPGPDALGHSGVWEYDQSESLSRTGTYEPLGAWDSQWSFLHLPAHHGAFLDPGSNVMLPAAAATATGPQQFVTSALAPHELLLHPFTSRLAVLGWRSPENAVVAVTGGLRDVDANCGDGIAWQLHFEGAKLAEGTLANGAQAPFPAIAPLTVAAGARLRLSIDAGADDDRFCDSTAVDLTIRTADPAAGAAVTVAGTANIWAAHADPLTGYGLGGEGGTAPVRLELAGAAVSFPAVTGWISCQHTETANWDGPDGPCRKASGEYVAPAGGISAYDDSSGNFPLVGVFLAGSQPLAPPDPLDASGAEVSAEIAPALGQVFRIGDGRTASGVLQTFVPPQGATELFLATPDTPWLTGSPASLVANGGFESDQLEGWMVGGEFVDKVHSSYLRAASGVHSLDINAQGPGQLWQDIVTEPGQRYELRFMLAGNMHCGGTVHDLAVRWDGQPVAVRSFDSQGRLPEQPGWGSQSLLVEATHATTRLEFESLTQGACGAMLDEVALRPLSGVGHERSPGAYADDAGTLAVSVSGAWAHAPPPDRRELTVNRLGEGRVTGGSMIDCPVTCTESFDHGTDVTLRATPDPHWRFVRWEGDTECSEADDCAITMDRDRTLRAVFERIRHGLMVELAGDGTGSVASTSHPDTIACPGDCEEIYDEGALVTLQAAPAEGSRLVGWSRESCGDEPTCVVSIDAASTVVATFRQAERTLTVVISGGGSGHVTSDPARIDCEPDCARSFEDLSTVRLTPQPDRGSYFVGWSVQGCPGPAACSLLMDESKTVVARFERIPRRLTVVIFGSGTVNLPPAGPVCSTTCHKDYADGEVITITAEPAPGWRFKAWSGGGACSGEVPACELTMDDARSVTATFELIDPPRRLTAIVLPERGGRVTGIDPALECSTTCSKTFAHGSVVNLRAEPASGYRFVRWSGGAPCAGTNAACDVRMDGDRSVTASFERVNAVVYRLIPGVFDPGMGRVLDPANAVDCKAYTCGANYPSGTAFVLRAEPARGYRFLEWALGPCRRSTTQSCAFTLSGPGMQPVAKFAKVGTPRPTIGKTAVTKPLRGSVSYQPPAGPGALARWAQAGAEIEPDTVPFLPLDPRKPIPAGSTVDATKGALRLTVQNARSGRDAIVLSGGMFVFRQVAKGKQRGRTLLELRTAQPNPCAAPGARRLLQRLTATGGGVFVVRSRFSESSAKRAMWTTEDRCESTVTKVAKGSVTVRDRAGKTTARVRAGRDHTVRGRTP